MRIIESLEEALEIAEPFINKKHQKRSSKAEKPWEITTESLKRTLKYVFEHLHFACYVLCADGDGEIELFKLENTKTAPALKEIVHREIAKIHNNKTLSPTNIQTVRNFVKTTPNIRILQCVLKPISDVSTTSTEYDELFHSIREKIPSGVYLLNLTDAHILRRDGLEPFLIYRGNPPQLPSEFRNQKFLPILSLSANENYWDIPIPNYDDLDFVRGRSSYDIDDFVTDWDDKTIDKAVFRGGPSGCGYTAETNTRIQLAKMKSDILDVGIVSNKKTIDSQSIRFDPVHGLGMMNTGIRPVPRLTYAQQSEYKYIIHVDGNVNAYRLTTLLATGSVVLRVKSSYLSWIDSVIQPKQHYISIRSDLSNLTDMVDWCNKHPQECRKISERASALAREILTSEYIEGAVVKVFNELGFAKSRSKSSTKSERSSRSSTKSEKSSTKSEKSSTKSEKSSQSSTKSEKLLEKINASLGTTRKSKSKNSKIKIASKNKTRREKSQKQPQQSSFLSQKQNKNPIPQFTKMKERDKCNDIKALITEKLRKKLMGKVEAKA